MKTRSIYGVFKQLKECYLPKRHVHLLTSRQILHPQRKWCLMYHTQRKPSLTSTCVTQISSFHSTSSKVQQVSLQGSHKHNISLQQDGIMLQYGEYDLHLLYIWLRDHCRCDTCYNHITSQKNVENYIVGVDVKPTDISFDGTVMTLQWSDKHVTCYNINWLVENTYHQNHQDRVTKILWNKDIFSSESVSPVPYNEFMTTDEGVKKHLTNLMKYGVSVVSQAPSTHEGTVEVSRRLCPLQDTFFGESWTLKSDMSHADTAYTKIALGAHNDTTYFMSPCGIQVFHVLEHDGVGGETLLVDGFYAAENLREKNSEAFDFLTKAEVAHEFFEAENKARSLGTVLRVHPTTGRLINVRFNPYDRSPLFTLAPADVKFFYQAYDELSKEIRKKENEVWIKLQPDMVLFVDNWRVMHGRAAFTGFRHVSGCYLTRDDWISNARVHSLLTL